MLHIPLIDLNGQTIVFVQFEEGNEIPEVMIAAGKDRLLRAFLLRDAEYRETSPMMTALP